MESRDFVTRLLDCAASRLRINWYHMRRDNDCALRDLPYKTTVNKIERDLQPKCTIENRQLHGKEKKSGIVQSPSQILPILEQDKYLVQRCSNAFQVMALSH